MAAKRKVILVVEDSPTVRRLVAQTLKQAGYETVEAEDGRQAVRRLQRMTPAAIVLDLSLPIMDGFQFLELCQSYPTAAEIPVVVLTALSDPKDVDRALSLGVEDFLVKPVDPPLLVSRVTNVLRHRARMTDSEWVGDNRRQFVRTSLSDVQLDPSPRGLAADISEGGISWYSRSPPELNKLIKLNSPQLFGLIGLNNPILHVRVVASRQVRDAVSGRPAVFRMGGAFVGLRRADGDAIRRYIFQRQAHNARM